MGVRLGDLLVERGVLTPEQRDDILRQQGDHARPFGAIAEERFGVSSRAVEEAWAEQYASIAPRVDPRLADISPDLLKVIDRRQAWQFGVIPVERTDAELRLVTSQDHLARALRFAGWSVAEPVSFAICSPEALVAALSTHYPIAGMDDVFIGSVVGRLAAG